MWCITAVTPEFITQMEHILSLYHRPYDPDEPVLCFDEKSLQLLSDVRTPQYGKVRKRDSHYKREGTANIFVTVEPKGGFRTTKTTKRRRKADFAKEIKRITELPRYRHARTIHIVLDNLNTHKKESLIETFGEAEAERICSRVQFHYPPPHASWLNMAEIEISVMSRQALRGRIGNMALLMQRLRPWRERRNRTEQMIHWKFTKQDARSAFRYHKRGGKIYLRGY